MPTPSEPISVALVNDYPVVVQGVARMLEPDDRLRVVELDSLVDPGQPVDLVLFDAFAASGQLFEDVARLQRDPRHGRLVVYTWDLAPGTVSDALDVGVRGCLSKALDGPALADALVRVHRGEVVVDPEPPRTDASGERVENGDWPGRAEGLSARESEVVALITRGWTNDEIATGNFLSINSVKSYIRSAYRKMGVERRSQAVLWGVEHGMLPQPSRTTEPEPH